MKPVYRQFARNCGAELLKKQWKDAPPDIARYFFAKEVTSEDREKALAAFHSRTYDVLHGCVQGIILNDGDDDYDVRHYAQSTMVKVAELLYHGIWWRRYVSMRTFRRIKFEHMLRKVVFAEHKRLKKAMKERKKNSRKQ